MALCGFSADVSSYANQISTNMIVSNDGNVTWLSMVIFKSSCEINVKYFPFDEQHCQYVVVEQRSVVVVVVRNSLFRDNDLLSQKIRGGWGMAKQKHNRCGHMGFGFCLTCL